MTTLANNRCHDPHQADAGYSHPTVEDTLGFRSIRSVDG